MHTPRHPYAQGRHEHGQNFLTDARIARQVAELASAPPHPILEIGPGEGALTFPLERLGLRLTAVEIHPELARSLRRRTGPDTEVICADFLDHRMPRSPHTVVGNLPFHLTTAILRKLLHDPHWAHAVLITQWEVARRRAGIGGSTVMTAQWAPFYEFGLAARVPARSYTPAPSVDGGILTISRRTAPLLPWRRRKSYAHLVHRVFTGRGRGIAQILRNTMGMQKAQAGAWLGELGIRATALPKDLEAEQWAGLFIRVSPDRGGRSSRPARRRG